MKTIYTQPKVDLIMLDLEDVITTSGRGVATPGSFGTPEQYGWGSDVV